MEFKLNVYTHEQCCNNSFTVNMAAYSLTVQYHMSGTNVRNMLDINNAHIAGATSI